jgi:hypothetical protein
MYGREATEEFAVTRFEPPTALDLLVDGTKGTSGTGVFRLSFELSPVPGGGTTVRLRGEIGGLGFFGRLIGRLFVGRFRKLCAEDLDALARHLDRIRGDGAPGRA